MKFFNELSLKNKIFVSCLGFTLLVSVLIALFTRALLITSLTGELKKRGIGITQAIADSSRGFILTENRAELTGLAYDARIGNRKDIVVYTVITDKIGHVLAHTFTTGMPKNILDFMKHRDPAVPAVLDLDVMGHSVFHVSVPVKEGIYTIGFVHAGLDKQHIDVLISRLRMMFFSFLSVVSVLFFFLSHRLALHITKPVAHLIRYADQMSQGGLVSEKDLENMSRDIQTRDDEIAALTNSFIRMTSELRLSTARLKESQEKYRSLFRSGPNPIFVIQRKNFEILDANPKATELFGYERRELIGMSMRSLGDLDDDKFNRNFPKKESVLISAKVRLFKKNKETLFVNIHACPAEYRDRDVIIVGATDISELVEKDSQLIQASKMTNIEKMSVGIAHEINQPLNAIKMGSEYLCMMHEEKRKIQPEDLHRVAAQISTQVTRASEIVDRLKTFSRKADFAWEVIDINRCIRSVYRIIGRQITLQNIELKLSLDETIPRILAHNNRMEQVIFNLVTNARDAINEKAESVKNPVSGKIRIFSFSHGGRVGFLVRDNGVGIEPGHEEDIFDSFYTTKPMGEGLGLGLPIIKGIVQDYNGTIALRTKKGEGACFTIEFPAYEDPGPPDNPHDSKKNRGDME